MMTKAMHPIAIDQPMVLIPAHEYRELLIEAGYAPTPQLDLAIAKARRHFKAGKTISWETLKRDLR